MHNWNADSILVLGDVVVDSLSSLTIQAGTKVIFTGYYGLKVRGRINAVGLPDNRIEFKCQTSNQFELDTLIENCWRGIVFDKSNSILDSSKFEFCNFSNVKYLDNSPHLEEYEKYGGVIRIFDFSNLLIRNCVFKNNVARYGTAISCFYHSNPQIISNLITSNLAIINAPAIFNSHSYPKIINNTITNNKILVNVSFSETGAIYNFISKPLVVNNIVFNNRTFDTQVRDFKNFYTYNNNIDGTTSITNYNYDPLFADSSYYQLSYNSACRNAGVNNISNVNWPSLDLLGQNRVMNNEIDLGACEYNNNSIAEKLDQQLAIITNYPNPFNNSTLIKFNLDSKKRVELKIVNLQGAVVFARSYNGSSELIFDGSKLSSGIYFCQLTGAGFKVIKNMLLLK